MGSTHDRITPELRQFIEAQRMFFVATAPLSADAHVNLSPKGLDSFRVLDERSVAYLDLTGSGNETSAHLEENGRITFMFCAFDGPPKIARLYGRGRTLLPDSDDWQRFAGHFEIRPPGTRQILAADIDLVMTSCGFGVPRYEYVEQRDQLVRHWEKKGSPDELAAYHRKKNFHSIDGIVTTLGKSQRT
jgi:Pyridoxamine 5'-phosphate oxidase